MNKSYLIQETPTGSVLFSVIEKHEDCIITNTDFESGINRLLIDNLEDINSIEDITSDEITSDETNSIEETNSSEETDNTNTDPPITNPPITNPQTTIITTTTPDPYENISSVESNFDEIYKIDDGELFIVTYLNRSDYSSSRLLEESGGGEVFYDNVECVGVNIDFEIISFLEINENI